MTLSDLERQAARVQCFPGRSPYTHTVWPTAINFSMVTHIGRDNVLVVSRASIPKVRGGHMAPNFGHLWTPYVVKILKNCCLIEITVEYWIIIFIFLKVVRQQFTDEVDNFMNFRRQVSYGFYLPKFIWISWFFTELFKGIKVSQYMVCVLVSIVDISQELGLVAADSNFLSSTRNVARDLILPKK